MTLFEDFVMHTLVKPNLPGFQVLNLFTDYKIDIKLIEFTSFGENFLQIFFSIEVNLI